jgi:hypothetical protein
MGARSFMPATRIPMPRDRFDAWLRTPLPRLDIIENPSAVYAGWADDGADPDWDLTGIAAHHPSAVAGIRADRARTPLHLLAPPEPPRASLWSATGVRRWRSRRARNGPYVLGGVGRRWVGDRLEPGPRAFRDTSSSLRQVWCTRRRTAVTPGRCGCASYTAHSTQEAIVVNLDDCPYAPAHGSDPAQGRRAHGHPRMNRLGACGAPTIT